LTIPEIANTPTPPYYAVIFTSIRVEGDDEYGEMAQGTLDHASNEEWFLGAESARERLGITVCYWDSLEAISKWKNMPNTVKLSALGARNGIPSTRFE